MQPQSVDSRVTSGVGSSAVLRNSAGMSSKENKAVQNRNSWDGSIQLQSCQSLLSSPNLQQSTHDDRLQDIDLSRVKNEIDKSSLRTEIDMMLKTEQNATRSEAEVDSSNALNFQTPRMNKAHHDFRDRLTQMNKDSISQFQKGTGAVTQTEKSNSSGKVIDSFSNRIVRR